MAPTVAVTHISTDLLKGKNSNPLKSSAAAISPLLNAIINNILTVYTALAKRNCLDPCDEVNALFTTLVSQCAVNFRASDSDAVLAHPAITAITQHLREICSSGEFRMELWWAKKILSQPASEVQSALEKFTYYDNYVDLTRLELNSILSAYHSDRSSTPTQFVFIGSGPLPLTSICLASEIVDRFGGGDKFNVHNIDIDPEALRSSEELCSRLLQPVSSLLTFQQADAADVPDLSKFDVVYLAALVGVDTALKREFTKKVWRAMRPGALLVIRSAHSLRSLLYPVVDTDSLESDGFDLLMVVHPYNHIINSVIIAERRE